MITVVLPPHLRTLARIKGDVSLQINGQPTLNAALDEIEERFPMLCGTIRDHITKKRRAYLRFFACGKDISHEPTELPLPEEIASGKEPLYIIGAISGG